MGGTFATGKQFGIRLNTGCLIYPTLFQRRSAGGIYLRPTNKRFCSSYSGGDFPPPECAAWTGLTKIHSYETQEECSGSWSWNSRYGDPFIAMDDATRKGS